MVVFGGFCAFHGAKMACPAAPRRDHILQLVWITYQPPYTISKYQVGNTYDNQVGPGSGSGPKKMVLVTQKKSFSYRGLTAKNSDSLAVIENMASSGDLHTHNPW